MDILVTYDVSTTKQAGRRRLRRVAQLCENVGQRVQQSVFECRVDRAQYEALVDALTEAINEEKDSLRIYRLAQPVEETARHWGQKPSIDFDEPLIL